jgi:uncharacterized protein YqeY
MLQDQLDTDLKAALKAGDQLRLSVLRSLKSALTYAKVDNRAKGGSDKLTDDQVLAIFAKEAKKRQESADVYSQNGVLEKAATELKEKEVIEGYLPAQFSEDELNGLIDKTIDNVGATDMKQMGQVIAAVKEEAGVRADGAKIAQLVKAKLG